MVKTKVLSALAFPSLCYSIQASYANLLILMEPSDQLEPLTAEEQEEKEQLLEEVNITCNTLCSSIFIVTTYLLILFTCLCLNLFIISMVQISGFCILDEERFQHLYSCM